VRQWPESGGGTRDAPRRENVKEDEAEVHGGTEGPDAGRGAGAEHDGAHFGQVEGPVRMKWHGRFGSSGTVSERSDAGVDLVGGRVGIDWAVGLVTSHRGSFGGDAMSVMNEAIEDGVAEGGIADDIMPVLDGELAGDESRAPAVSVFEYIEEVTALRVV
jgi:hypothetical protein